MAREKKEKSAKKAKKSNGTKTATREVTVNMHKRLHGV
jgi:hypothetical protein